MVRGEPLFIPGGEHGVILVHGMTGLPAELKLMAEYLASRGFTVLVPRLAGHGTTPEDLMHRKYADWLDTVRDAYAILRGATKRISVVGHSLGALLSLYLTLEREVYAAVSIAAPIFIAKEQGIDRLPPYDESKNRFTPRVKRHLADVPEEANLAYRDLPLIAIHELLFLIDKLKGLLGKVKCPLLVMHSEKDRTADPKSALYIMDSVGSSEKELVCFQKSGHLLPLDVERDEVFSRAADFLLKERKYGQEK